LNGDKAWFEKTTTYFNTSPRFGPGTHLATTIDDSVSMKWPEDSNPHYLKPPSARTGFEYAIRNGIASTLQNQLYGITREHIFMSPLTCRPITKNGDSGSAILNKFYEVEFMAWGGDSWSPVLDVTYASFFPDVIADIERKAGWQPGSCVLLDSHELSNRSGS